MNPNEGAETTASSFHTSEEQDATPDVIIAHALKEACAYAKRETTPHPYAFPEQLSNGMVNPLASLFADCGRVPKDYRSRLRRRELAEATEPTYTPDELMGRIRSKEPGDTGGVQRRIHIQTPTDPGGYPVVFFTTHPGPVVYINGIPCRRRSYQNIMRWCSEVVEPTEGDGKWGLKYLAAGSQSESPIGLGALTVEPRVYFDGEPVSLDKVPELIRRHGALYLLEQVPLMIGDSLDAVEWLFGRETQDFYRMKALISSGRYLENPYGEDPYDIFSDR
jgi:hypothetical protein